jgi:hypothetical protein
MTLRHWWTGILPESAPAAPAPGRPLLTGDALTEALVPLAVDLVHAVHADNRDVVGDVFGHAAALAGDPLTAARHLAVLAAGMCSEDHGPTAALGWTLNPAEYRRLRHTTDALSASLRAGRTAHELASAPRADSIGA